jgi:recombination protein RecT
MSQTVSQAVEKRQDTLARLIQRQKAEIARALPRHLDPDRLARIATTVMRQTPQLGQADPASFLGALMTCAQLGLEPGPLGHAYLVPFKDHVRNCRDRRNCNCRVEVTFIPGYRGLAELARRSGQVAGTPRARVVREGDEFDYEFCLDAFLKHKPAPNNADAPVTHAYAIIKYKDGSEPDFDVMTRSEIDAIRERSKASASGPWVTDYAEMAKKTVLRRLLKTAPMSVEYQQAIGQDEAVRTRLDPSALDIGLPFDPDPEVPIEGELVEPEPTAGDPEDWPTTATIPGTEP